ncbi:DnaD domain protein [Macrococcoides caseolyticum]|uniref:DNA replication protein DnaD n=1 Tax=Macrococcoides caseolyticum TaxID=69966 RepID=A0ACC9MV12_9STAP|nr:DnaD domain protein [Macrococcus caseolyticus]PKE20426.1 DNA replication protein DnaD [Macrococcus caseolyticus]PKE40667.1 DNA replication protein DnaD [Macrococcus caseolyticus]PKE57647.1 DNA replication protein DnaD [Macrococcus caseolyticus]PKF41380.1 DNA replication protein DnaD [Macrococcus caseolyticus]
MSNKGWISLHRSVTDHWLFDEDRKFSKFEAWIDLLLMVNHTDKKMMLGNELITIKRGQKVTSIRKLCERWNWSNNKVKNFLNVLEADGMLTVKSDSKKTLVTVVNYDVYQNEDIEKRHQSDTKATQKHHESDAKAFQKHTNNNVNNVNNENNVVVEPTPKNDFAEVIQLYQSDIQATPPLTVINKLSDDFDMFGKDIMLYAIKKSALAGNRDYRFIDYLTKDWRKQQLKTLEAVEQYEDKRNQPKQSNKYSNDRNAVTNKYADRPDLSFQALEIKKGKGGLASFTDEERKAYESYYL